MKLVNLVIGSVAGGLSRYLVTGIVLRVFGDAFPYGTLAVNSIGCFIIGFLMTVAEEKWVLDYGMRLLLVTGFCGAFTTFSAFILETSFLFRQGEMARAVMNIVLSVGLGFLFFELGAFLGRI